jgi:hypothetical protein
VRAHRFAFAVVAVLTVVIALANLETLLRPGALTLPLLGTYAVPTRLFGLVAILAVSGLFVLIGDAQRARLESRDADYLRRIDALRSSLDAQEAGRFDELRSRMDAHLSAITAKLETLKHDQRAELERVPVSRSA